VFFSKQRKGSNGFLNDSNTAANNCKNIFRSFVAFINRSIKSTKNEATVTDKDE